MASSRSTTTGPSYSCWRCGQQVLEGCTHHCPTVLPQNRPIGNVDLFPKVQGRCPHCGCASLFLGDGGYVTCAMLRCGDPTAASQALEGSA